MKKIMIVWLLMSAVCLSASGQSVNALFNEFRHEKHAEYVSLSPLLFRLIKGFAASDKDSKAMSKIRSIRVLDMEECSAVTKARFAEKVGRCRFRGFDELVRATDDGEQMRVLLRLKRNTIRDLLVLVAGDDCAMVHIKGKIKKEELDRLVNEHTPKKKKHGR